MSDQARDVPEAVQRLSRRDPTLQRINLSNTYSPNSEHLDPELAELVDCLLAHPDVVTRVWLDHNELTDETGVKLARYLAASSTVEFLGLSDNQLGSGTYLALAAALRVNSSLRYLYLYNNQAVDRTRIEAAFVEALQLNPDRPVESVWRLYSYSDDFTRLRDMACELGHPSLQLLLAVLC